MTAGNPSLPAGPHAGGANASRLPLLIGACAGGEQVWRSRTEVPAGAILGAILSVTLSLASEPLTGIPEPGEAAQWNATWEDLAAQPIRVGAGEIERFAELPGVDDSLARRLASPTAVLPAFVHPYVRREGQARLLWRARAIFPDPASLTLWQRSATHSRLLVSAGRWDGGLVLERDSGEPGVVDYVSGALAYRSSEGGADLVFGHIRAHVGSGLLASRPSAFWMDLSGIRPRPTSLSGTLAATESGELFGGAGMVRRGTWELLLLVTHPRWDATVTEDGIVTNLRTDGVHVTDAERQAEKRLGETYALAHLGWLPGGSSAFGVSVAQSRFSLPVRLSLSETDPVNGQTLAGLDVRLRREPLDVWGEVVRDMRGPTGAVGATTYELPPVTLVAAGWSYGRDLVLPHGVGWSFREEPTDEKALLAGARWRCGRLRADAFGAGYRQDRASRVDSLPREGTWEELRARYQLTREVSVRGRWKHRTTVRRGQGGGAEASRREYRAEVLWEPGVWAVGSRAEWVDANRDGTGVLAALSCARGGSERLTVDAQLAAFRSTTSDAALYLYDVRAPGYGAIRMLNGTGAAWSGRLGGRCSSLDWSLAASGVTRWSGSTDVTLAAQLEYRPR